MKKILLVALTTTLLGTVSNAQETPKITYYTADSLASGSVKNLFTGFFQLAFDNLTGKNRSFNFSSNPYALLLKNEPNLAIDSNYAKYTRLRRLNFNFGINIDSNWHFNGFQSGVKFKIIDQRDSSISKALWNKIKNDSLQTDGRELGLALTIYIRNKEQDPQKIREFEDLKRRFFNDALSFNKLPARFREVVDSIIEAKDLTTLKRVMQEQPDSDFKSCITDNYNRYKQQISNALLWTAGISDTTYKDQFFFSNIVIYSQLSKGLTPQSISTLAVEAQSALNFTKDSLQTGRNLKRCFLDLQGGLQWVFRTKDYTPLLDCSLLAKYRYNFNGRYAGEKINAWYISGKINVRIVNDIWIPLIIDYDPANHNLTAALQVKYNFTTLQSLFNYN